jgi:hypothetical protein
VQHEKKEEGGEPPSFFTATYLVVATDGGTLRMA